MSPLVVLVGFFLTFPRALSKTRGSPFPSRCGSASRSGTRTGFSGSTCPPPTASPCAATSYATSAAWSTPPTRCSAPTSSRAGPSSGGCSPPAR